MARSKKIVTARFFFSSQPINQQQNPMSASYTVCTAGGCRCKPGETQGVVPVSVTAQENLEVWGSCGDRPSTAYEFGCNHFFIPQGETVLFPTEPLSVYDKEEGLHMHVRTRASTPHSPSTEIRWETLPLNVCQCAPRAVTDSRTRRGIGSSEKESIRKKRR